MESLFNATTLFAILALCLFHQCLAYYHGRHMCTERRNVQHPVPVTQSYRRAVYRKDLGKVVYVTAHKTIFKMEMRVQLYRRCCKGWEKRLPREAGCLVPVCKESCLNGGQCIAPDLCMCPEGYAGYRCQADINECSGRHDCQQKCINVPGTYECACQHGFVLAEDEMSCNLCLSCTPEFKSMMVKMSKMDRQIHDLEQEKQSLQDNLTLAVSRYEEVFSKFEDLERDVQSVGVVTSLPSTTQTDYVMHDEKDKLMPLDRLASLSQQISMLEERMADCDCRNDWY